MTGVVARALVRDVERALVTGMVKCLFVFGKRGPQKAINTFSCFLFSDGRTVEKQKDVVVLLVFGRPDPQKTKQNKEQTKTSNTQQRKTHKQTHKSGVNL